jgi:hypothetical protein
MKTLLAFIAVAIIASIVIVAVSGALRVRNSDQEVNITIDKGQLKEKTEEAVEKARELGERLAGGTRPGSSASRADRAAPRQNAPEEPDPAQSRIGLQGEISEEARRQ